MLYAELSGRENLSFIAQLYGRRAAEADLWLDRVGLRDAADRRVQTYSRGMKQRLSIARALLPEPSLVLFDEPLTGLDRDARGFVFDTIDRLRRAGRCIAIVTHHLDWPTECLDTVLVLDGGRVRFEGAARPSLAEVYGSTVRA